MNSFDQLRAVLEKTILHNIASKLPPNPAWAEQWVEPTSLHWFGVSVDTYQDGRLYTAYSFGKVKNHHQLYRENMSRPEFDYDGLDRARMNEADEAQYFELRAAISPLAEEENDEDEAIDPAPPTLLALALILEKLRKNPSLFPMPVAPTFSVTLSDDYETGTWAVTLAALARADFDEWTDERIERFWGDSAHAPLARRVRDLLATKSEQERSLSEIIAE